MRTALTPDEVGSLIGAHPTTVRSAVKSGDIPGIRVGKLYRIPISWIRETFDMTDAQIAAAIFPTGDAA